MSKKKATTFGEKIRQLRKEQHLPQRKVAALLDMDASLLARYERNERHPSKEMIAKIAKVFNANCDDLIKEALTDRIAYQILEEEADGKILRIAESKVEYLKEKKQLNQ